MGFSGTTQCCSICFGVAGPDSIRGAQCLQDSVELRSTKEHLARLSADLASLRSFEITTNTTASIIAQAFELVDRPERRSQTVQHRPWRESFVQALGYLADARAQRLGWIEHELVPFPSPGELLATIRRHERLDVGVVFSEAVDRGLREICSLAATVDVGQPPDVLLSDPVWMNLVGLAGQALVAVCIALDDW